MDPIVRALREEADALFLNEDQTSERIALTLRNLAARLERLTPEQPG